MTVIMNNPAAIFEASVFAINDICEFYFLFIEGCRNYNKLKCASGLVNFLN